MHRVVTAQPTVAQEEPSRSIVRLRRGSHRLAAVIARGSGGGLAFWLWEPASSTPLGLVTSTASFLVAISMSAELRSLRCAYCLARDPGRSVPMTALALPLLAPLCSSSSCSSSGGAKILGGAKFSPHDATYSNPSTSGPDVRRVGARALSITALSRSSFIVASSCSSAIEAGETALSPPVALRRACGRNVAGPKTQSAQNRTQSHLILSEIII